MEKTEQNVLMALFSPQLNSLPKCLVKHLNQIKTKQNMLTSCHSKSNKKIMHVCSVGAQHPAQGVHQPANDRSAAAPTGVDEQADERSCHRALEKELTSGTSESCFLSEFSCEDKE